jgi:hypothetical protein
MLALGPCFLPCQAATADQVDWVAAGAVTGEVIPGSRDDKGHV